MQNSYKIPDDLAEKIRKESAEIARKSKSRAEEYDAYLGFVESQKEFFQEDIKIILEILNKLIIEGKLYIHTKLVARIKDSESAIYNDDIIQSGANTLMGEILKRIEEKDYDLLETDKGRCKTPTLKMLDDVFGITIITDTQEEVDILYKEIQEKFKIEKYKKMNKPNYHATHLTMWKDPNNEQSPLVECQLKTRQDYIDSYDHTLYKVESNIERKLEQEDKIQKNQRVKLNQDGVRKVEGIIQEYYDKGKFSIISNIPRMWEATFNEDEEEMKMIRLTEQQILKRVYPSIVIRSDKMR